MPKYLNVDLESLPKEEYNHLKWKSCTTKKPLQRTEAESLARWVRNGGGGRHKGKRRKQNSYFFAYQCIFDETHWHVGHNPHRAPEEF